MILSNLRCTSGGITGAYYIDVAGKEMFIDNVGGELTGVGEGAVTVVIGIIYAGAEPVLLVGHFMVSLVTRELVPSGLREPV